MLHRPGRLCVRVFFYCHYSFNRAIQLFAYTIQYFQRDIVVIVQFAQRSPAHSDALHKFHLFHAPVNQSVPERFVRDHTLTPFKHTIPHLYRFVKTFLQKNEKRVDRTSVRVYSMLTNTKQQPIKTII